MSSVISRPEWPQESWTGCCAAPLSTKLGLDLLDQLLVQLEIAAQEASDQAKVLLAVRKAGRARLRLLQPIRQIGKVIAQTRPKVYVQRLKDYGISIYHPNY